MAPSPSFRSTRLAAPLCLPLSGLLRAVNGHDGYDQTFRTFSEGDLLVAIELAVVTLARTSGIPADAVQNGFVLGNSVGDVLTTVGMDAVTAALDDFYNEIQPGVPNAIADFISPAISRAADACTIEHYDITAHLDGSNFGAPVRVDSFTLGASDSASALPSEVACAL